MNRIIKTAAAATAAALGGIAMTVGAAGPAAAELQPWQTTIKIDSPVAFESVYIAGWGDNGPFTTCLENFRRAPGLRDTGVVTDRNRVASAAAFASPNCTVNIIFRSVRLDPAGDAVFRLF
ncbi:hypothetical protein [Williamsia sp. CHRR-6]|uniref:hypothetical protein n=1 Tax=Williamsia sp. CHRR-6 TaxID=2835871 RepID=UPI001BDAB6CB|nr:hypothetical protein [Williamsia sp. CHRR-6]MBT0568532.1 hypothetical protein [Williamsia sp. CHRR-6]